MSPAVRATAERHTPVLRDRILQLLEPALSVPGAVFVDATLGMGGHTEAVLTHFPQLTAYGVDRDAEALALAEQRLGPFGDRFIPVHCAYDDAFEQLSRLAVHHVHGVLFDLGVSSLQLDEIDRGFSYSHDAPLDMRMDQAQTRTAADVLNTYEARDLERVLREYGEERFARRIVAAIVRQREHTPFERSGVLVDLLRDAIPAASARTGGHPAKRTFQALRIEVNGELESWERALPAAVDALAVGGRIAVLAYHSLEDRIVKRAFADGATSSTPVDLPVELPEHQPYLERITRGAERPSPHEIETNPRAASARLRVAERCRSTPKGPTS
ncbi:16S rRNA (cytosine(1402)-N(4))-methyltransferase RsmH [Dermatophilaceae bacterium Sec6.4]